MANSYFVEAADDEVEGVAEGEGDEAAAEQSIAAFRRDAFHAVGVDGVEVAAVAFVAAGVAHHSEGCHLHSTAIGAGGVVLREIVHHHGMGMVERTIVTLVDAVGVRRCVVEAIGVYRFINVMPLGAQ